MSTELTAVEPIEPRQMIAHSETARTQAEIQAALMVAASRPRDELRALDRIRVACQRQRLAENAEYSYSKGGADIAGPSIRLLETCARYWGNLKYGFRELSQAPGIGETPGESTVEAFAWDLETNTSEVRVFVVPHAMRVRGGIKTLSDPRDIYEHVANMSQRRVRACLEHVVPKDIVEEAQDECRRTVSANVDINKESIGKLREAFAELDVTSEQLAKRIGRNLEAITPAQFLSLRRIYNSLKDGLSTAGDFFPEEITPHATASDIIDAVSTPKADAPAGNAPPAWEVAANDFYLLLESDTATVDEIDAAWSKLEALGLPPDVAKDLGGKMNERRREMV